MAAHHPRFSTTPIFRRQSLSLHRVASPFFYSRSRSRLAAPDSPQNDSSGPSEVSVDSDEIKSWKKSKPKVCITPCIYTLTNP